jgi:hypothetical protein
MLTATAAAVIWIITALGAGIVAGLFADDVS